MHRDLMVIFIEKKCTLYTGKYVKFYLCNVFSGTAIPKGQRASKP